MSTVVKSKVDKAWEEYESLTVSEQENFLKKIVQDQERPGKVSFYIYTFQAPTSDKVKFEDKIKSISDTVARNFPKNKIRSSSRKRNTSLVFQNKLIKIEQNRFLKEPKQFWLLISLFGEEYIAKKANRQKRLVIDDQNIMKFFEEAEFKFYVDKGGKFLFSNRNELFEMDFGELDELTALEALKKFGLENLENAKEKGYIKI